MQAFITMNNQAVDMLFGSVRKMPAEKQTWRPLDEGRSAIEQCRECASVTDMFQAHIDPSHTPRWSTYEDMTSETSTWDLDKCESECKANTAKLNDAIAKMSPEQMEEIHTMPWGSEHSGGEIAGFHYWNLVYHIGQINYIQTLYGDREM